MNMNNAKFLLGCVLILGLAGSSSFAEEQVYGWELMTKQERNEHRTKMQNMKTAEERERYRIEHHKMMQERAKEQGVTLPDKPLMHQRGMGGGQGGGKGR